MSSQISKIKSEGRIREAKAYEKYNQGMKTRKEVYSQAGKKTIVKNTRATVTIKEKPQATYVPIYFKAEINEAKRSAFFDD